MKLKLIAIPLKLNYIFQLIVHIDTINCLRCCPAVIIDKSINIQHSYQSIRNLWGLAEVRPREMEPLIKIEH